MSNRYTVDEYRPTRRTIDGHRGLDRQQRLLITLGVSAAVTFVLGLGIGFAVGRATVPEPEPVVAEETDPVVVEPLPEEDTATADFDTDFSEEVTESAETTTADIEAPDAPRQTAPRDGAVVDGTRVYLRWTEVEDESAVTYAFEIQDRLSSGTWGNTQVIKDLTDNQYSARVLPARRRWRVWAVDEAGNASAKSGWRTYWRKAPPASSAKPSNNASDSASDETT